MTGAVVRYGLAGLVLLGGALLALWPWFDGPGRRGLLVAGAVAWPIQVAAFALLVGARERQGRFLAVWAGGTLVRMALIGVAAYVLTLVGSLPLAPTLLGLAGFFFGLLLLEPLFFET